VWNFVHFIVLQSAIKNLFANREHPIVHKNMQKAKHETISSLTTSTKFTKWMASVIHATVMKLFKAWSEKKVCHHCLMTRTPTYEPVDKPVHDPHHGASDFIAGGRTPLTTLAYVTCDSQRWWKEDAVSELLSIVACLLRTNWVVRSTTTC
jgi:hypothetical protein